MPDRLRLVPAAEERLVSTRSLFHFEFLLFLAFYYLAYRYPLQINSSVTSPTYSDTPASLAYGKYAIYMLLIGLYLGYIMYRRMQPRLESGRLVEMSAYGLLCFVPIAAAVFNRSEATFLFQTGLFFFSAFLFTMFPPRPLSLKKLSRIIHIFLYLAILFEAYQIYMFRSQGRLPALAYEGSVSVRFGSVWDDPNGFALVLSLLYPVYLFARHRILWKIAMTVVVLAMLVYSQSITGLFAFVVSMVGGTALYLFHQRKYRLLSLTFNLLVLLLLVSGAVFSFFVVNQDAYQEFISTKSNSISDHMAFIQHIRPSQLFMPIVVNPIGMFAESGYINMIVNFGLVYFLLYLVVGIVAVSRLLTRMRHYRGHPHVEVYYGAFFFMLAFFVGLMNLPYDSIFPINLLYAICILLSTLDIKQDAAGSYRTEQRR